jgi:GH24 family phage-related lysozyme (muramidase)
MKGMRIAVAALTLSAAGFASWVRHEGSGPVAVRSDGIEVLKPYIPTQGDVPTIGHGSTRYEEGRRVTLADPPITRSRAEELARNLNHAEERRFAVSLPGVLLTQEEFDLYMDFVGQYGMPDWSGSSMRRELLAGRPRAACDALLNWRFQAGRDCKLPQNWGPKGCKGVWLRQQARHQACIAAQ